MRFLRIFTRLLTFATVTLAVSLSYAANSGITYQGRILKPDGSVLSGTDVYFRIQLRSPDSNNCLLYEEIQRLDMHASNGQFALTLNDGNPNSVRTSVLVNDNGAGFALPNVDRLFQNRGTFTFNASDCTTGTSYAPNSSDGRKLVVEFKDETMAAYEPIPSQTVNYVPFAFEAKSVAGFPGDSLLRVLGTGGAGTVSSISPLSNADYTKLIDLIAGSSASYQRAGYLGGGAIPSTGSLTNGQVLSWNSGAWVATTPGGAGSVGTAALADQAVTAVKLAPAVAGAAGQLLSLDGSGNLIWSNAPNTSQWTTQAPGINYMGGSVGIGTTSPASALDVRGSAAFGSSSASTANSLAAGNYSGTFATNSIALGDHAVTYGNNAIALSTLQSTASGVASMAFGAHARTGSGYAGTGGDYSMAFGLGSPVGASPMVTGTSSIGFFMGDQSGVNVSANNVMSILGGNVGIGTTAPLAQLQVEAPSSANIIVQNNNATTNSYSNITLRNYRGTQGAGDPVITSYAARGYPSSPGNVQAGMMLMSLRGQGYAESGYGADRAGGSIDMVAENDWGNSALNTYMAFKTAGTNSWDTTERMRVTSSGNVGIGTSAPTAKLQLAAGTATLAPFKLTSSGAGVLLSTVQDGAMEYDGTALWFTIGNTRYQLQTTAATSYSNVSNISNSSGSIVMAPMSGSGSVQINSGTSSLSSTSGALIVTGGAGISGALNTGGNINAAGAITATGNLVTSGGNSLVLNNTVNDATSSIKNTGATGVANMQFLTGASTRMTIDSAGNVGIGTTSPSSTLHVNGTANVTGTLTSGNIVANGGLNTYNYNGASYVSSGALNGTNTVYGWNTWSSDTAASFLSSAIRNAASTTQISYFGTVAQSSGSTPDTVIGQSAAAGYVERMRLAASGNVGIGTTLPTYKIHASGSDAGVYASTSATVAQPGNGNASINVENSSSTDGAGSFVVLGSKNSSFNVNRAYIGALATAGATWSPAIVIGQSGTSSTSYNERMRIDSNGNVGIGTTSPTSALEVNGAVKGAAFNASAGPTGSLMVGMASNGAYFQAFGNNYATAGQRGGAEYVFDTRNSGTGGFSVIGYDGTSYTRPFKVATSGNVGIGTTSPLYPLTVVGTVQSSSRFLGVGLSGSATSPFSPLNSYNSASATNEKYWDFYHAGTSFSLRALDDAYSASTTALQFNRSGTSITSLVIPSGNVGIGTTSPVATLDVNGFIKMKKNSAAPATCDATTDGAIAMTATRTLCVCDATSWKQLTSPASACVWP